MSVPGTRSRCASWGWGTPEGGYTSGRRGREVKGLSTAPGAPLKEQGAYGVADGVAGMPRARVRANHVCEVSARP